MPTTLETIQDIFRDVLDDDSLTLDAATTAGDVEGWDSLVHVTLMMRVEKTYGLRFRVSDISELKNVGELVHLVESMQGST